MKTQKYSPRFMMTLQRNGARFDRRLAKVDLSNLVMDSLVQKLRLQSRYLVPTVRRIKLAALYFRDVI
jgi:hypothetical protein